MAFGFKRHHYLINQLLEVWDKFWGTINFLEIYSEKLILFPIIKAKVNCVDFLLIVFYY